MSMSSLTGIHILISYGCSAACAHCFVWGDPQNRTVMSRADVQHFLDEAKSSGVITSIAIEGGEPFLYPDVLLAAIRECSARGYGVGVLSNGFWATSDESALTVLRPLVDAGLKSLSVSTDEYHTVYVPAELADRAIRIAQELGINAGKMVTPFERVMFRGRAAKSLAGLKPERVPWDACHRCPRESLATPKRVHLDLYGSLHICQGIVVGNMKERRLSEIIETFEAASHPIVGPLVQGGPTALAQKAQEYGFQPEATYADECHLCYSTREFLRSMYPDLLRPDEMYGRSFAASA
jgi:hypothetical protein